ncbi:MAG: hypothetical protein FJ137_10770 [Deltaproteobacteria bacterium]|nr:hypothetical protein [Deltaproteobacteria bacterium]
MRVVALLSLVAALGVPSAHDPPVRPRARAAPISDVRVADLQASAAGLFLRLVNEALRGRIDPRAVTFRAPAALTLEDTVLSDPGGAPVARIKRIDVELNLRALLSGELAISRVDAIEPRLLLEVEDGKLNLLEALSPRKKPSTSDKAEGGFRIDDIRITDGGFRLRDGETITITADDIDARATLDVDLTREFVHVDVRDVGIATASVRLKALDVPLRALRARRVNVLTDLIDLVDVSASALGGPDGALPQARLTLAGTVRTKGAGELQLKGNVDAAAGAWPDRLAPLALSTPSLRATVGVRGPFADPRIELDGDFGPVDAYGYRLDGGVARIVIDKRAVSLAEGTVARTGRGTVRVAGDVRLPAETSPTTLDLRVRLQDVAFAAALAPAKLDTPLRGALSASARVTGRVGEGDGTELVVAGSVDGRGLTLYDLQLPIELDSDVRVVVKPRRIELERVRLTDPMGDFDADVAGSIYTADKRLDLTVVARVDDAGAIVTALPSDLPTRGTAFRGRVHGPYDRVVVEGDATVDEGRAWGLPFSSVAARVRVTSDEVRVEDVRGALAGGSLAQQAPLVIALGKRARTFHGGRFALKDAALTALRTPSGATMPLSGRLDVEATLAGSTERPRVLVRAAAGGLVVSQEPLGAARAAFVVTKDALEFSLVDVDGPLVRARGTGLRLDTDTLRLTGAVDIAAVDLSRVDHARSIGLKGRGAGVLRVDGDVRQPTLRADLVVRGLAVKDWVLGDGRVSVGLAPDVVAADVVDPATAPRAATRAGGTTAGAAGGDDEPARPLVVTVAASTGWDLGRYDVRAGWALDRGVLSLDARINDLDLSLLRPLFGSSLPPLSGTVNGTATLAGRPDALTGRVRLRVPELAVSRAGAAAAERSALRTLGALFVDARLDDGALSGLLCAFPDPTARSSGPGDAVGGGSPCAAPHRLWATLAGTVAPSAGRYVIDVDAGIDEGRLEDLVPALASRELGLGAWVRLTAHADKQPDTDSVVTLDAHLRDLIVRAPGAPTLRLQRSTRLRFADRRARIVGDAARFIAARDDVDVVITAGSSVGADDVDLNIEGDVALSALKLLTQEVANAAGTARTALRVSGRFDDGVRIEGSFTPATGARLTLRSLQQPLVFETGTIRFQPDEARPELLRVEFVTPCERRDGCPLKAQLGEGRVQLKGAVLARTSRTPEQAWVEAFDLALSGTGLPWSDNVGRLEASGDLTLKGDAAGPVLAGRVEVSDGLLHRDFELRNFVLSSAPEAPSEPLWRRLMPYGLGALAFDVEASMQNVRTKARINAFSVDASLRGELHLGRSLKLPSLGGTVEVEEGTVEFPRARFDIVQMQLQFPTSGNGSLQPLLHLSARTDLAPGVAGNDVEVPVELAIDGSFDAMQLDLTAVDAQRQWSRTELLAFILFGTIPADTSATFVGASVAVAQRAALRELAAPVSQQIEQIVGNAGLDFNIDVVSGWQLELGRRLVLEGQGLLSQQLGATDSTTTATTTGTTGTDALRVRLLLYDHLPIGRALSAEGRIGATSDLRLSWRLFEE